jgi:hypothetical protein
MAEVLLLRAEAMEPRSPSCPERGLDPNVWNSTPYLGRNFFKMVGNRLGVSLDFDEETARSTRFDVARIKVLSTTCVTTNFIN